MTSVPDLAPAARRMAGLLANVHDSQLTAPTPCADYTLGTLLDHVDALTKAFVRVAQKDFPEGRTRPPAPDASRLPPDWRDRIPEQLDALAAAWRAPSAWEGMTWAGGVDLPGEVAGSVALDELVVHGWDIARATGQPYTAGKDEVATCLAFVGPTAEQSGGEGVEGLFGPAVDVPADAPPLDRLIAMTGRDPSWTAP